MLSYFRSDRLELIETDSICLRVGLSGYKNDENEEKYMRIAGVNYGANKNQKKSECIIEILTRIQNGEVSKSQNAFLLPYKNFITKNLKKDVNPEEATQYYVNLLAPYIQNGFKAFFEIK
jgi:hypothetical protein